MEIVKLMIVASRTYQHIERKENIASVLKKLYCTNDIHIAQNLDEATNIKYEEIKWKMKAQSQFTQKVLRRGKIMSEFSEPKMFNI